MYVGLEHRLPAAPRSPLLPLDLHLWKQFVSVWGGCVPFSVLFSLYCDCIKFQTLGLYELGHLVLERVSVSHREGGVI